MNRQRSRRIWLTILAVAAFVVGFAGPTIATADVRTIASAALAALVAVTALAGVLAYMWATERAEAIHQARIADLTQLAALRELDHARTELRYRRLSALGAR